MPNTSISERPVDILIFPYRRGPSGGESPCFGPSLHGKKPANGSENTHGDECNRDTEEFPSTRCGTWDNVNERERDDDTKEDGGGPHDNEGARCGSRRESEDFKRTHWTSRRGHAEASIPRYRLIPSASVEEDNTLAKVEQR